MPSQATRALRRRRRGVLSPLPLPRAPTPCAPVRRRRARWRTHLHHNHRDHRGIGARVRAGSPTMTGQCEKSTHGRSEINREIRYETTWDKRRRLRNDAFEAPSRGLHALCVRFAAGVAPGPRNTRFRLVANLDRSGLSPAGSRRRFPACLSLYMAFPLHQASPGAIIRHGASSAPPVECRVTPSANPTYSCWPLFILRTAQANKVPSGEGHDSSNANRGRTPLLNDD